MSEAAFNTPGNLAFDTLRQIAIFCISEEAEIEPSVDITLEVDATGRHTKIGRAHIASGAVIDALVHVEDNAIIGKEAQLKFRSTIREGCKVGDRGNIGTGSTLEEGASIDPSSTVGNFTTVAEGSTTSWGTSIGNSTYIGPGLTLRGSVGHHSSIR